MSARRERWLSLIEVAERIAKVDQRMVKLTVRRRRERALRFVRKLERRYGELYSKRDGREVVISQSALEILLPDDIATVGRLEQNLVILKRQHLTLQKQVNGHGAKLREHGGRIGRLETKVQLTMNYLKDMNEAECRTIDA
jgi:hypothetical protein